MTHLRDARPARSVVSLPATVDLHPELAQAALRQRQTVPLACWAVLRAADAADQGRGWLERGVAARLVASYRQIGERRARGILADGAGTYWTLRPDQVWLHAPSRVAAACGVERVGRTHVIPLEDLRGQAQLRATLAATCYHTDGGGSPLTRRQVRELTGVSEASQRRYENQHGHAERVAAVYVQLTHVPRANATALAAHHPDSGFHVGRGGDAMRRHGDIRRASRHTAGSSRKTERANHQITESARRDRPATKTRGERSRRAFFPLTSGGGPGHKAWMRDADALGKPGHEAAMSEAAFDYAVIAVPKRGGGQRYESAGLPDDPGNRLTGSSQTCRVGHPPRRSGTRGSLRRRELSLKRLPPDRGRAGMSRTRSRATRRTRTPQLEVQWVAPADLVPDPANPRTMDAAEDSKLDRSLTELGFRIPILARHADRVVIDGHQRLRAALRLGLEAIPVLFVDDLDEAQARLLNLAINNIHGRWDDGMLARLMADLQAEPDADLAVAGFDEAHVRDLLRSLDTRERRHRVETFDVAAAIEEAQQGKEKIKPGDLWQLGPHRLICGDATDAAAVERLLDGGRGMMAFQDPPYNVALGDHGGQQRGQRRRRLANDALPPAAWQDFCRAWARHTLEAVDGAIYVCMSSKEWPSVCSALSEAGGHWSDTIVWRKDRHVLGRADYQRAYEPIWYGWREGAKRHWCGDRDQADVWEIPRAAVNAAHPTQKPLALVERAIENSSRPADLVVDLFLGSGTTLLAAERTGRICAGLELDPHYCDVVIARWEAFTGAKAERVEAGRPPRKERTAS